MEDPQDLQEVQELRQEVFSLRDFVVQQSKEIVKLKKHVKHTHQSSNCADTSDYEVVGARRQADRLTTIEQELDEQKRSTEKITKLCLAAIQTLDSLEQSTSQGGVGVMSGQSGNEGSLQDASVDVYNDTMTKHAQPTNDSQQFVHPSLLKSLCAEIEKLTGMLVKVDDDIDALDARTDDNRVECEQLTARWHEMEKQLSNAGTKSTEEAEAIRREVDARLLIKDVATRADLALAVDPLRSGITLEEVARLIEASTANFLKTLQGETAACEEKTVQSEERAHKEMLKLQKRVDELEKAQRVGLNSFREELGKQQKESTSMSQKVQVSTNSKISTMEKQLKEKTDSTNQLKQRLHALETDVASLASSLKKSLAAGNDQLVGRVAGLEKEVKTVGGRLDKVGSAGTGRTVDQLRERLEAVTRQAEAEHAKLARLEEAGRGLEKQVRSLQEDKSGCDESRLTARIDRLGREITSLKSKQQELSTNVEHMNNTQSHSPEVEKNNLRKVLSEQDEQHNKITKFQQSIDKLNSKTEETRKYVEDIEHRLNSKMECTALDDLKTGMEKERCKIQYFQDKILNIAKSVEAVKMENNTMRDRFCTDIENHDQEIGRLNTALERQAKEVAGNSLALRDITTESIGKIKEVAANSLQIEKNIRSINEKSVLFDNSLKEMHDQIWQNQYQAEQEGRTIRDQIQRIKTDRPPGSSSNLSEDDITHVKGAVKTMEQDLKNLIHNKNTKDLEDEERRLSMEGSLLDLRNYVETGLFEANSQLGGIAGELDSALDKISKCEKDMTEMEERADSRQTSTGLTVGKLEANFKQLTDQVETEQRRAGERVVEEFDRQWAQKGEPLINRLARHDTMLTQLEDGLQQVKGDGAGGGGLEQLGAEMEEWRTECGQQVEKLTTWQEEASRRYSARFVQMENKQAGVGAELGKLQTLYEEGSARIQTTLDLASSRLDGVEQSQADLNNCVQNLHSTQQTEDKHWREGQAKTRKETDGLRQEIESRLENNRKTNVEMIGALEIKMTEMEDRFKDTDLRVDNLKVVENNHAISVEKKMDGVRYRLDSMDTTLDKLKSITSERTKDGLMDMKKKLDCLAGDLVNYDIDSFKNIVNSTNETQNKLIHSMQKSMESVVKDNTKLDTLVTSMEDKLTGLTADCSRADKRVSDCTEQVQSLECAREALKQNMEEQINNAFRNIREIYEKLNKGEKEEKETKEDKDNKLKDTIQQLKVDMEKSAESSSTKLQKLEQMLDSQLRNVEETLTGSLQSYRDELNKDIAHVNQALQETSALSDTRMNQALEKLHNHTSLMTSLQATNNTINTSIAATQRRIDLFESRIAALDRSPAADLVATLAADFASVSALEHLQIRMDKAASESAAEADTTHAAVDSLDRRLSSLCTGQKSLDLTLNELKRDNDCRQAEFKQLSTQVEKFEGGGSASGDELKSLNSKFNQQKSKIVDVEASVNFQERALTKLEEELKKINGSVFGNISTVEDRLSKLDEDAAGLTARLVGCEKRTDEMATKVEASRVELNSQLALNEDKVGQQALDKLQSLVTERVESLKKDQEEKSSNLHSLITTTRTHLENIQADMHAKLAALDQPDSLGKDTSTNNNSATCAKLDASIEKMNASLADFEKKLGSQKVEVLSECSEKVASELEKIKTQLSNPVEVVDQDSTSNEQMQMKTSMNSLEKGLRRLEDELRRKLSSHQESNLSLIDKQRRSWEATREKAEQMSQIFDSLIITNDRPYVSCGLDSELNSAGFVVFNQFELINKIEWECHEGFSLVEPGVYLLQISGTLTNATAAVKLVSDDLEAELVSLVAPASPHYKARSTIFTVEDDDRDAEKIVVEIQDKDGTARVDSDFSLLMYKISEVSTSEAGADAWRLVDL